MEEPPLKKLGVLASLTSLALLAACGSNAGTSLPAGASAAQTHHAAAQSSGTKAAGEFTLLSAFTARSSSTGQVVRIFPTRQVLAQALPASGGVLQYYGGPVQTKTHLYIIFWGSQWSNDPDGVKPLLQKWGKAMGASKWFNTVTQYYQIVSGKKTHITNPKDFSKTWTDTSSDPSSSPTDAEIQAEAVKASQHFGDTSVDASYAIALPTGSDPSGFGTEYCAYHDVTSSGNLAYTNLPYMPDAGGSCGAGIINNPGTDDGVTIVEGHEQAETTTDPQIDAWLSAGGEEIGDLCAWQDIENNKDAGGYPTQPLWSNASGKNGGACVQSYK